MPTDLPLLSIPAVPNPQSITLPGGVRLDVINLLRPGQTPGQAIQPALAPLLPIFDIVSAVTSMFDLMKSITEAIGDPSKLAELPDKIAAVASLVANLLSLLPQVALPQTIIDIIDIVIDILEQALAQIEIIQLAAEAVTLVSARAAELGDPQLQQVADTSQDNLTREIDNLSTTLNSAGSLLGILSTFLSAIGVSETVPDLSSLSGVSVEEISEPIRVIIRVLRTIRGAIPVP